jgi:hypothetical protein
MKNIAFLLLLLVFALLPAAARTQEDFDKEGVTVCIFAAVSIVIRKLLYNMYTSGIYYSSDLRPVYAIARRYL